MDEAEAIEAAARTACNTDLAHYPDAWDDASPDERDHYRNVAKAALDAAYPALKDSGQGYDYQDDDDYGEANCQTCLGEGYEECEDANSSEGCWEAGCNDYAHLCPNCRGSGKAKDQWYW